MGGRSGCLATLALAAGLFVACTPKKRPEALAPEPKADVEANIAAFENRKRYPVLTVAILKQIPDADLEQALTDFVDCKLEKSGDREREVFSALSPGFRAVFSTSVLEGEVDNGGFNQFFWNSSGAYAADAVAGLELLGATAHARLMRRAISIRDADRARTQTFKSRGTIEAFSESYKNNRLNDLDREFYKLANLSQARIKFVRARPELFVGTCGTG
jgi:hypothetical protein